MADTRYSWLIAVSIALCASTINNLGLNFQKLALTYRDQGRAKFLYLSLWIAGFVGQVVGALCDFAALGFGAQSIVAPLGAWTLVANVVIAPAFLGEKVTLRDLGSTALIVAGCAMAVSMASHEDVVRTSDELFSLYATATFGIYIGSVVTVVLFIGLLARWVERLEVRHGRNSPQARSWTQFHGFSYAGMAGITGAQSVLFAKSIVELFTGSVINHEQRLFLADWRTYPILVGLTVTLTLQVYWMQCGLARYDALLCVPVFSSLWLLMGVVGGGVVYHEFDGFTLVPSVLFPVGILLCITGVYFLSQRDPETEAAKKREAATASKSTTDGSSASGVVTACATSTAALEKSEASVVCVDLFLGVGLRRTNIKVVDIANAANHRICCGWVVSSLPRRPDGTLAEVELSAVVAVGDLLVAVNGESLLDRWVSHNDVIRRVTDAERPMTLTFRRLPDSSHRRRWLRRKLKEAASSASEAAAAANVYPGTDRFVVSLRALRRQMSQMNLGARIMGSFKSAAASKVRGTESLLAVGSAISGSGYRGASLSTTDAHENREVSDAFDAAASSSHPASAFRSRTSTGTDLHVEGSFAVLPSALPASLQPREVMAVLKAEGIRAGTTLPTTAVENTSVAELLHSIPSALVPGVLGVGEERALGGGRIAASASASSKRVQDIGITVDTVFSAATLPAAYANLSPRLNASGVTAAAEKVSESMPLLGRGGSVGGAARTVAPGVEAPPAAVAPGSAAAAGAGAPAVESADEDGDGDAGEQYECEVLVADAGSARSAARAIGGSHARLRNITMDPMAGVLHMGSLIGPGAIFGPGATHGAAAGGGDGALSPQHPLASVVTHLFPGEYRDAPSSRFDVLGRVLDGVEAIGAAAASAASAARAASRSSSARPRVATAPDAAGVAASGTGALPEVPAAGGSLDTWSSWLTRGRAQRGLAETQPLIAAPLLPPPLGGGSLAPSLRPQQRGAVPSLI